MNFGNLGFVCLYVSDMDESLRFYRDILGLNVEYKEDGFIQLATGTVKLAIEPGGIKHSIPKKAEANPYLLQFMVQTLVELEEMTSYLEKQGVRVFDKMRPTHYGTLTNFTDPDGNKLELLCKEGLK